MYLDAKLAAAFIVTALAVTAPSARYQQRTVPVVTLSGNGTDFPEQFTLVNTVREIRDGRVWVADPCERGVFILDFDRGTRTKVSREGQGPGEYQLPYNTFRAAGDTTLILDIGAQTFLSVTPAGTVRAATSPVDLSTATRQIGFTFSSRVFTDSLGRIYTNGRNYLRPVGQPTQHLDSVAITRFDPRSGTLDTVAFISTEQPGGQRGGRGMGGRSGTGFSVSGGPDNRFPFLTTPTWIVAPDGSVGIIRPEPFTVEWVSPQKQRSAPRMLAHQPVRVTEADREEARNPVEQYRGGCSLSVRREVPGGVISSMRMQMPAGIAQGNPVYNWPDVKHPYVNDDNAVLATPEGEIMILLQRAANDSVPAYNVYNREGTLLRRLQLPPRTRLVGLGRSSVYLARNDRDGLQYLRRYRASGGE